MSEDNTCHVCGETLDEGVLEDFEGMDVHEECLAGAARLGAESAREDELESIRKGLE